jgi:hypothetical protein
MGTRRTAIQATTMTRERAAELTRRGISPQSLQSTYVTSIPKGPLHSRASKACALPILATCSAPRLRHACTEREPMPSTRTSASRCRHHRPRVAYRLGADSASCGLVASPCGMPVSLRQDSCWCIRPYAGAELTRPLTPLSLFHPPPAEPGLSERARTLSTRGAPTPRLP